MINCPSEISIVEMVKVLGTWFLVVFGWLVVSDQQEAREVAKNVAARLSDLRKELVSIENLAIKHHTGTFDMLEVRALLRAIGDLSSEIAHWRKLSFVSIGVTEDVMLLRRSITERNMDSSTYVALAADDELIKAIEESRFALDKDLQFASHKVISAPRTLGESVRSAFGKRLW